jgi:hypothetical protein
MIFIYPDYPVDPVKKNAICAVTFDLVISIIFSLPDFRLSPTYPSNHKAWDD